MINAHKYLFFYFYDSVKCFYQTYSFYFANLISDLNDNFSLFFPQSISSLMSGLILGNRQKISQENYHYFKVTGILHLIVASGSNISLLFLITSSLLSFFQVVKKYCLFINLWVIWTYTNYLSFNPPILRAAVMASYFIGSKFWQRQYRPLWCLALSLLSLLLVSPDLLTDLSFQLSLSSTLGIIFFQNPSRSVLTNFIYYFSSGATRNFLHQDKVKSIFSLFIDSFLTTVSAQIVSLPIIMINFQEYYFVSILANTLLLGFVPILNILGIAGFTGVNIIKRLFYPGFLALFFATCSVTQIFLWLVSFLAQFEGKYVPDLGVKFWLGWWAVLVGWLIISYFFPKRAEKCF